MLKVIFTHDITETGEVKKRFTTERLYWDTSEFCVAATNTSSGGKYNFIRNLEYCL